MTTVAKITVTPTDELCITTIVGIAQRLAETADSRGGMTRTPPAHLHSAYVEFSDGTAHVHDMDGTPIMTIDEESFWGMREHDA